MERRPRPSGVIHGDCFELLPLLDVDYIFTSPPYFNHVEYGEPLPFTDNASYRSWIRAWFSLAGVAARRAVIVVHQRHFEDLVGTKATKVVKLDKPMPEYVYIFGEDLPYAESIKVPAARDPRHPCPFSEKTVRYFLEPLGREYSVLDCFAGLGTTVRIAKEMGFEHAIGIEREAKYIAQSGI